MGTKLKPAVLDAEVAAKPKRKRKAEKSQASSVLLRSAERLRTDTVAELESCNTTELVDLCLRSDVKATCMLSRQELIELYLGERNAPSAISRVGVLRDRINEYMRHDTLLRTGPECPRDCWQHPDLVVLCCYERLGSAVATIAAVNKMTKASMAVLKKLGGENGSTEKPG